MEKDLNWEWWIEGSWRGGKAEEGGVKGRVEVENCIYHKNHRIKSIIHNLKRNSTHRARKYKREEAQSYLITLHLVS